MHLPPPRQDLPEDAPIIVLLPGLTGGSSDTYVQHAVQQARAVGVRAAVRWGCLGSGAEAWQPAAAAPAALCQQ
jgi:predicted alpha/beta-fold hydrolase